jgi:addiction module HigA family antidote
VLREEFVIPLALSTQTVAMAIGVGCQTIEALFGEELHLGVELALRIAAATGTQAEYWLDLQRDVDLFDTRLALTRSTSSRRAAGG